MFESRTREFCNSHPDEEVTYFCLDCENSCVCSECVIHGTHKNHEVQSLRKASSVIKQKLQSINNDITVKIQDLIQHEARVQQKRKELTELMDLIK